MAGLDVCECGRLAKSCQVYADRIYMDWPVRPSRLTPCPIIGGVLDGTIVPRDSRWPFADLVISGWVDHPDYILSLPPEHLRKVLQEACNLGALPIIEHVCERLPEIDWHSYNCGDEIDRYLVSTGRVTDRLEQFLVGSFAIGYIREQLATLDLAAIVEGYIGLNLECEIQYLVRSSGRPVEVVTAILANLSSKNAAQWRNLI
jgi:hypothetical protein